MLACLCSHSVIADSNLVKGRGIHCSLWTTCAAKLCLKSAPKYEKLSYLFETFFHKMEFFL